jgi:signal recognition particle GTPase
MLGKLSSSLKESIRKIAKAKRIDKRTVDELVRDIQRALIQADVKISLVIAWRRENVFVRETGTVFPEEGFETRGYLCRCLQTRGI